MGIISPIKSAHGLWRRANDAAEKTPEGRNRYIDLLRAASIGAVVFGHWLLAAPSVQQGEIRVEIIFAVAGWTVWLTWAFQVMPLFFIVGGYSNAASWESALRRDEPYGEWIAGRLARLVLPVVPLVVAWSLLAYIGHLGGVSAEDMTAGSIAALRPLWFLAVYVMIVITTPIGYRAWKRFGARIFFGLAACAAIVDLVGVGLGYSLIRWANFAFVWLAVQQLGYMWRGSAFSKSWTVIALMTGGLAVLFLLIFVAGYPVAMMTVRGAHMSNSMPPTIAMLALGLLHLGIVLALQAPAKRWLQNVRPWAATILINRSIMTIYLWHSTIMVAVIGLLALVGGVGLTAEPGTSTWWLLRPVWLIGLAIILVALTIALSPIERMTRRLEPHALPRWQAVVSGIATCLGFAQLALHGIHAEGPLGFRLVPITLIVFGAALAIAAIPKSPGRPA